jgi:hypothetical protein
MIDECLLLLDVQSERRDIHDFYEEEIEVRKERLFVIAYRIF